VDDDKRLLRTTKGLLSEVGHVTVAHGGQIGFELLLNNDFDLILCDIFMPGMGGPDLLDRVREMRPELAHRVVFVTGIAGSRLIREMQERDNVPLLQKPIQLRAVEQLLSG
jgi:CheY-like chemotaxis protein